MSTLGNVIIVTTRDEFEFLRDLPTSLSGWYDPTREVGRVFFTTPAHAVAAWRLL